MSKEALTLKEAAEIVAVAADNMERQLKRGWIKWDERLIKSMRRLIEFVIEENKKRQP
jgi:hypothetical protein